MDKINIFWFRRDLRLRDNIGLLNSLSSGKTLLLFIYDDSILRNLKNDDPRLTFISSLINNINKKIEKFKSNVLCKYGNPIDIWKELISEYEISNVFFNRDYEPYAIKRDQLIIDLLTKNNIKTSSYKDHLVFEKNEVSKNDGNPYTVYTPYKNKWISSINSDNLKFYDSEKKLKNLFQTKKKTINLEDFGFKKSSIKVINPNFDFIKDYEKFRDFPSENKTSFLSPHLRFGSISIRECVKYAFNKNKIFLSELIWREFYSQILYNFPHVVNQPFKAKYSKIKWRNNNDEFQMWCSGKTGYPIVDAGMNQLNSTGYMHNRVRMITASFLVKHLLIDWRLGERYFAEKLLDFDLSSNNGNWQWVAGTGCDSA
ncbi:DNA photolyase family protein, partial [Bacteroidota bacterium]|nr:DNA photolyase family protein [Bacteroidota bacterium]